MIEIKLKFSVREARHLIHVREPAIQPVAKEVYREKEIPASAP
jgi:hypothetical protein